LGFSPSSDVSSGDPATDATLEERLEDALQNRPPLTREQLLEKEEEDPSSPENQEVLDQVFSEGQQVALLGRGLETTPQRGVKSRLSFDPGLLGGLAVTDGTVPSRADEDSPPLPDSSKNRAEEPRPLPEHSDAASVPSSFPREQSLSGPVAAALFALAVTHPWWVGDRDETRRSTRGKRRENRNL